MEELVEHLSRSKQTALQESAKGMYTKKKVGDRIIVTGGKRLKDSGAYTTDFNKRVANLFKKGSVT